ncbi:MAG TPA: hypothetical protein DHV22_08115 [Xanthomarina gelatinilytica]|uniref:Uncharacterized protein n=1 Tax=Xanthomarina gelatinilytica TaxID=1137281 RepID=A0A3D6BQU9_9FLAO|nr:hypothetical protein [Xanthomarina gelatinilytica]
MAVTALNTIKNWFKTGLKPTQAQFWATWDSFWHKDQNIPQANITNLQQDLLLKQDKEGLHAVATSGDYNDLENLPGGIVEVNTYEDIPLEEGTYLINTELPSNPPEPPYELSLNTNLYRFDDGYRYKLKELVSVSKAIITRNVVGDEITPSTKVFKDFFYINTSGELIGECIYSIIQVEDDTYEDYNFTISNDIDIPISIKKYYIEGKNGINKGFLNLTMEDVDVEEGLIITKIPFSKYITKSHIFKDNKEIAGPEIGVFKGFLAVKWNNGEFIKNTPFKNLTLRFDFEDIESSLLPTAYVTKNILNSRLNVVNAETISIHSSAMVKTFSEVYDISNGFPNQVYKDTYNNILSFKKANNIKSEILSTNCDIIFSAETQFFTNLRNTYTDALIITPVGGNLNVVINLTDSINKFPPNYIAVTSRAETDNDGTDPLGTSYGFGTEFNEPTLSADLTGQGLTDWPGSQEHQQSPATAIVAAKLKKIKDETGAPWDIVREAARQTASNAGSYNIYRGFGVIDVNAAIAAIPAMLDARSLELAEYFEATSKFPKELKYEDKLDNTPVVKRDIATINASNSFGGQIVSYAAEKSTSVSIGNSWAFGNAMSIFYGILQPVKGRIIALSVYSADNSTGTISVRKNHIPDTQQVLELNNSKSGYVLMNKSFEAGDYIQPIVESGSIGSNSRVVFWVKYD